MRRNAVLLVVCAGFHQVAGATSLAQQTAALREIRATADSLCQTVPITQQHSTVALTAEASAKVKGVAARLAQLGVSGSVDYRKEASSGVLQRDLARAIQGGNNCRLNVFNTLQAKMVQQLRPPSPPPSIRPAPPRPQQSAVSRFNKPTGYFLKTGKVWREYPELSPGQYFRFMETGRDPAYVYLSDLSRAKPGDPGNAMLVRLPLKGGPAQWSWQNPLIWSDFTVVFPASR